MCGPFSVGHWWSTCFEANTSQKLDHPYPSEPPQTDLVQILAIPVSCDISESQDSPLADGRREFLVSATVHIGTGTGGIFVASTITA